MPTNYANYVVRNMQAFGAAEPTQMRHIAAMMLDKPEIMRETMVRMFTANVRPTYMSILKNHTKTREFENDKEYSWMITGTAYKNIPLIEARDESGSTIQPNATAVGKGGKTIYLLFPEKYFFKEEIIVGELNEYYQFRIIEEPIAEGYNYLYATQLKHRAA